MFEEDVWVTERGEDVKETNSQLLVFHQLLWLQADSVFNLLLWCLLTDLFVHEGP